MGTGIVNIENILKYVNENSTMTNSEFRKILDKLLKEFFQRASMKWENGIYHRGNWRTKQANIDALKNGRLGYYGVHDDLWSSQFKSAYNKIFTRLRMEEFQALFTENKNSGQGVAIQRLLNQSVVEMVGCKKENRDYFELYNHTCNECDEKWCFRKVLLETYSENEFGQVVQDRAEWLNAKCNFSERYEKNKEKFQQYFIKEMKTLEQRFKEHNEKQVKELLNKETGIQNKIRDIKEEIKNKFGEDEERGKEFICKWIEEVYLKS